MPDPFALHGAEKMIYDIRMGPAALCRNDVIYIPYQANPDGPEAHPHVITYDLRNEEWSAPVRVGEVRSYDHHFCPVLWFDKDGRSSPSSERTAHGPGAIFAKAKAAS